MGYSSFSAGSKPAGQVHPVALTILSKHGIIPNGPRSKSWDEFEKASGLEMELVITVCGNAANETCPVWFGAPMQVHWGVEDPAAAAPEDQTEAFETAFQILKRRAEAFHALPEAGRTKEALAQIGSLP